MAPPTSITMEYLIKVVPHSLACDVCLILSTWRDQPSHNAERPIPQEGGAAYFLNLRGCINSYSGPKILNFLCVPRGVLVCFTKLSIAECWVLELVATLVSAMLPSLCPRLQSPHFIIYIIIHIALWAQYYAQEKWKTMNFHKRCIMLSNTITKHCNQFNLKNESGMWTVVQEIRFYGSPWMRCTSTRLPGCCLT